MKKASFILFCIIGITACNSSRKDAEELQKKYKAYYHNLKSPDVTKAHELDESFKEFFAKYKTDTLLPVLLFEDALLNKNDLQNPAEAMKLMDRIVNEFPNHKRIPEVLFTEAFIYSEQMHDVPNAVKRLDEIIKKYPSDNYAKQAEAFKGMIAQNQN